MQSPEKIAQATFDQIARYNMTECRLFNGNQRNESLLCQMDFENEKYQFLPN
jgi:hypothetical protein